MQLIEPQGPVDSHPLRRRSFPRHPTFLPAQLIGADGAARSCIIRDYCAAGALLELEREGGQIKPDDQAELHCSANGTEPELRFRVRVAHRNGRRVGVALLDPAPGALLQLEKRSQRINATTSPAPRTSTLASRERPKVIAACNAHVHTALRGLIARFHSAIGNELFETAKQSRDPRIQSVNFGALAELNNRKKTLEDEFLRGAENRLRTLVSGQLRRTVVQESQSHSLGSLSLVEDQEFDTWLSATDFLDTVRSRFREPLDLLDKRLSVVFGESVGADNNPYGPELLTRAFQDALDALDLQHAAYLACYKVFKQVFLSQGGRFYEELNRILIDHGILPQVKYGFDVASQDKRARPNRSSVDGAVPGPGGAEQAGECWQPSAGGASGDGQAPQAQTEVGNAASATGNPGGARLRTFAAGASGPRSRAAEAGPVGAASSAAASSQRAGTSSDLFQLFGALHDLQSGQVSGPRIEQAQDAAPTVYTATELQQVLARPLGPDRENESDSSGSNLRQRVENTIAQRGEGDSRSIGGHEGRVIDVTGEVFRSLLTDAQVPREVQPWLKGLEIPVLRVALADNSVFLDTSHVVRQVINKLSRLEVLADAEQGERETAIRSASTEVVETINRDFDGTVDAFVKAVDKLDELIHLQSEIQRQNLKQVVAECLRTEGETRAAAPKTDPGPEVSNDNWLRRVGRLKEGHWVLFDALGDEPKRLKVAWIATRTNKYVFVNPIGKKQRVLLAGELAALLREGQAVVLDATEEPAMDRAQFAMLQKLHKQLLYESTHDHLTGLINRREFEKFIGDALQNAREEKAKHVLCIVDIDQFKLINNTCGYEAGDQMLRELVEMLQSAVGGAAVLSRIGPDEFGLLLHRQSLDDALELVEEQMERLEEYRFVWKEERRSVSMSVGMAAVSARSEDISELLQAAESSCAMAKEMGGGRIQMYHSGHAGLSRRKAEMEWAAKIDKALDGDELHLRCQRIEPIREDTGDHCHYELLLGLSEELGTQVDLQDIYQGCRAPQAHDRSRSLGDSKRFPLDCRQ